MDTKQHTIWDNCERHTAQLREMGASDEQVQQIRAAAQAVQDAMDAANADEDISLATITDATMIVNGWTIPAPTKQARFLAREAVAQVTGGMVPETSYGTAISVMAGLIVLKMVGDGDIAKASAALSKSGMITELAAEALQEADSAKVDQDALAEEYMRLMGFTAPAQVERAMETYLQVNRDVRASLLHSHREPSPASSGMSDGSSG